jgi:hypothetical protein
VKELNRKQPFQNSSFSMRFRLNPFLLLSFLLSVSSIAVAAAAPRLVADPDSALPWRADRPLTWADFRGKPEANARMHALTTADINVAVSCTNDVLTVRIDAVFRPFESWSQSTDSAPLLRHEQVHFDIAERCARQLRARLAQQKMTCQQAQTQLQPLIDAGFAEWQAAEDRYDA